MCRGQVLRAGMDGTVTGLDVKAVVEILKLYNEYNIEMFESILLCWNIEKEDA